jgi:hypothetical protein
MAYSIGAKLPRLAANCGFWQLKLIYLDSSYMKNLTDLEIVERKIASLTPEQIARWQTPAIGLYSQEIREEIKKQWIREYYQYALFETT